MSGSSQQRSCHLRSEDIFITLLNSEQSTTPSPQIRNQIIPLAIFVSTVIWFLVTFFFQAMFNAMGGIYIFLFYAVASLFFTFTTFLFIPEMTGKTEEEIAMFYRNLKFCKRQTSKV